MQSKPVLMDAVFDDADRVMSLIRERAPFPTLPAHYGVQGESEYDPHPFFRDSITDEYILNNRGWIEAARSAFDATIVQPVRCLINFSAAMDEMGAHIDLPSFRGFEPAAETKQLLMAMIHSGLFYDWMVPFASGLVWFYAGRGGSFLYWADGVHAPPRIVRPPFWNLGVMSDNEAMFHAVSPVGTASAREHFRGLVHRPDRLFAMDDGHWAIQGERGTVARLDAAEVRISLLWKARVFRDEEHMASFADKTFDLSPELIAEVFLADLHRRGETVREPTDPLDQQWQALLERAYPPPFTPAIADYV
jgi:hypothetical protein